MDYQLLFMRKRQDTSCRGRSVWFLFLTAYCLLSLAATTLGQTATAQGNAPTEVERITVEELKSLLASNQPITIIDARSPGSYDASDRQIKGAVRLTYDEIEAHLKEIPRDREIVTYCT